MTSALALLLALAAAPAAAQTGGTIRGTVTSGARPLAGAQVSIPGSGLGTLTNNAGQFTLVNVPGGQQTVRAQMLGFSPSVQTVTVAAGQATTLNFTLTESAIADGTSRNQRPQPTSRPTTTIEKN